MLLLLYVTVTKLLKLIHIIFMCNTIPTSDNIVHVTQLSPTAVNLLGVRKPLEIINTLNY